MNKKLPRLLQKYLALPFWAQTLIALFLVVVPVRWSLAYVLSSPDSLKASLVEKTPYGTSKVDVHEALDREWTDQNPEIPEWCSEEGGYHQYSDEVIMHVAYYEPTTPFSVVAVFCFDKNEQLQNVRMLRTWDWW